LSGKTPYLTPLGRKNLVRVDTLDKALLFKEMYSARLCRYFDDDGKDFVVEIEL